MTTRLRHRIPVNPFVVLPIDKDIPIPERAHIPTPPLDAMDVGDSVAVDVQDLLDKGVSLRTIRYIPRFWGRWTPWAFVGEFGEEDGRRVFRVWKYANKMEVPLEIRSDIPPGYKYKELGVKCRPRGHGPLRHAPTHLSNHQWFGHMEVGQTTDVLYEDIGDTAVVDDEDLLRKLHRRWGGVWKKTRLLGDNGEQIGVRFRRKS